MAGYEERRPRMARKEGGSAPHLWPGPGTGVERFTSAKESDLRFLGSPPGRPTTNSIVSDVFNSHSHQLSKPGLKRSNFNHTPTSLPQQSLDLTARTLWAPGL